MDTYEHPEAQVRAASGLNLVAGLWMILAPWVLGYATVAAALGNSILIGLAISVLAIARIVIPSRYEGLSWINFLLGLWLTLAPFFLGYASVTAAMWTSVIVGSAVLVLAAWSAVGTRPGI